MGVVIGIVALIGFIYLLSIPFDALNKAVHSVVRLTEQQWSNVTMGIILFFLVLTIIIGIVDIIRCERDLRNNRLRKLKTDNKSLGRELEELRRAEQQKNAQEQEYCQATVQEYVGNREQIERNANMLRYGIRRNKLCELLAAAGSRQADQMILRNGRGENARKQQERMLSAYNELSERFGRR